MSLKPGKDMTVRLGTTTLVGIGDVSMDGITAEDLDTSAFGNNGWKTFQTGMKDGGTISFSGQFDPADTAGQEILALALVNGTALTSIRIYLDSTSYFTPNQTTGYYSPSSTSNNSTILSNAKVTAHNIKGSVNAMATVDFKMKLSGSMVLV
jgi:hypothetical protein